MTILRVLLIAINASYTHTPLALYALKSYCAAYTDNITLASFTVNQTDNFILRSIYEHVPDIAGFSCAVWNIEKTLRIAALLKKLLPQMVVIFGGPEVAAGYEPYLLNGTADVIVSGEGEKPLLALLSRYADVKTDFSHADISDIHGIAWLAQGCVRVNPPDAPPELCDLPFPYPPDLEGLQHRIVYYEASRGCPFQCGYCLSACQSGAGSRLRLRPVAEVARDLRVFLDARVVRVKFTDRTFNADTRFAVEIWRFLMDNDNGFTNFHFEIAADLLNEAALTLLSRARPGLFQFEIGVQSVNPAALAAVKRVTDLSRLFAHVARIKSFRNIHLHLDLIAGLPSEDFASFKQSFNQTYAAAPDQLQLGFLKLLKGAPLYEHAAELGLVFSPFPPYEVLSTPELPYEDILCLKSVEDMVEIFHNSGKFTHTLVYLQRFFPTPFELFDRLAGFWFSGGYHNEPHGKMRLYEIFLAFCRACTPQDGSEEVAKDLLRFDLLANENEKSVPAALDTDMPVEVRQTVRALMAGRDMKTARAVYFTTDILTLISNCDAIPVRRPCYILFTYPEAGRQSPFTLSRRVKEITP